MKPYAFALYLLVVPGIAAADDSFHESDPGDSYEPTFSSDAYGGVDCQQLRAGIRQLDREMRDSKHTAIVTTVASILGTIIHDGSARHHIPSVQMIGGAVGEALGNAGTRASGQHRDAAGRRRQLMNQYSLSCK